MLSTFFSRLGCADHIIDPEHIAPRKNLKLPTPTYNIWEAGLVLNIRVSTTLLVALRTITPPRTLIVSLTSLKHRHQTGLKSMVTFRQSVM